MFLDNENYKFLLIFPCRELNIWHIAITFEKLKIFIKKNQNCSRISPILIKKFGYKNLTRLSRNCILTGGVF